MTQKINKKSEESMRVEIGFPECVNIELVQSNDLKHYEIFFSLVSLFMTASAGFWVSFATTESNKILLIISIVFTLMTALFAFLAFRYRSNTFKSSIKKTIYLEK